MSDTKSSRDDQERIIISPSPHQTASQGSSLAGGQVQPEHVHGTVQHTQQHTHLQGTMDQTTSFQSAFEQDVRQTLVGTLELREEVPEVQILREKLGAVSVRRERRVREETVTVDLVTEVLVIETVAGSPNIKFLGVDLPVGQTMELEIYREEAEVGKKVVRAERIEIYKEQQTEQVSIPVELAREELVVEKEVHARMESEGTVVRETGDHRE